VTLIRLLMFVILHGGYVSQGYAPHYAPGLMARVAERRGMDVGGCMVSSAQYEIGVSVYVIGVNTGTIRLCTVVDVSHPRDKARHLKTRRIAEISHEDARAICGTVSGSSGECPIVLVRL
jgi:hypothetical protein